MQDDAESMRLPDGEMPQMGGRLQAIEEELIEGGVNLSEELAREARAEKGLGETEEPAKPQAVEGLLLRVIESDEKMTRAILESRSISSCCGPFRIQNIYLANSLVAYVPSNIFHMPPVVLLTTFALKS